MISQGNVIDGFVEDVLETIHKYDETMYISTVIGALELVIRTLIEEAMEEE